MATHYIQTSIRRFFVYFCFTLFIFPTLSNLAHAQTAAPAAAPAATAPASEAPAVTTITTAPQAAPAPVATAPVVAAPEKRAISGADTAWLLICTVLVLIMTVPGIMLFYSGMLRKHNALSIVAHTFCAAAVITITWTLAGYSIAFASGNEWIGGASRLFASDLLGGKSLVHPAAPTVPESAFFLFQLAFAIITFAIIIGATAERMKLRATVLFAALWSLMVYAPVAHWIWHPQGWLVKLGHMDFAGGTVVHITAGVAGLVAAKMIGPRRGFGVEPMAPHNLMLTVIGAGLLWAGWFGFNAGSAFEANSRAVGALLATQIAAAVAAATWGLCEWARRGQTSVLGMATGAIAGLVAITPASGFVGTIGSFVIGAAAGVVCFFAVTMFKTVTKIDDSLDVFALHGVGGILGTLLTPIFALAAIAPVTANIVTQLTGVLAVMAYTAVMTAAILWVINLVVGLRVNAESEDIGLDASQHGEML
jgi:ammonium transporter, Amt family